MEEIKGYCPGVERDEVTGCHDHRSFATAQRLQHGA